MMRKGFTKRLLSLLLALVLLAGMLPQNLNAVLADPVDEEPQLPSFMDVSITLCLPDQNECVADIGDVRVFTAILQWGNQYEHEGDPWDYNYSIIWVKGNITPEVQADMIAELENTGALDGFSDFIIEGETGGELAVTVESYDDYSDYAAVLIYENEQGKKFFVGADSNYLISPDSLDPWIDYRPVNVGEDIVITIDLRDIYANQVPEEDYENYDFCWLTEENDGQAHIIEGATGLTLTVENSTEEDFGKEYRFEVYDKEGRCLCSRTVFVDTADNTVVIILPESYVAEVGEEVTFVGQLSTAAGDAIYTYDDYVFEWSVMDNETGEWTDRTDYDEPELTIEVNENSYTQYQLMVFRRDDRGYVASTQTELRTKKFDVGISAWFDGGDEAEIGDTKTITSEIHYNDPEETDSPDPSDYEYRWYKGLPEDWYTMREEDREYYRIDGEDGTSYTFDVDEYSFDTYAVSIFLNGRHVCTWWDGSFHEGNGGGGEPGGDGQYYCGFSYNEPGIGDDLIISVDTHWDGADTDDINKYHFEWIVFDSPSDYHNNNYTVLAANSSTTFVKQDMQAEDFDKYYGARFIFNDNDELDTTCYAKIKSPANRIIFFADSYTAEIGDTVVFAPHAQNGLGEDITDFSAYTIRWEKVINGYRTEIEGETGMTLTIDSVTEDDYGDYQITLLDDDNNYVASIWMELKSPESDIYVRFYADEGSAASIGDTRTLNANLCWNDQSKEGNPDPANYEFRWYKGIPEDTWSWDEDDWEAYRIEGDSNVLTVNIESEDDLTRYGVRVYTKGNIVAESVSAPNSWGKFEYTQAMLDLLNSGEWNQIVIDVAGTDTTQAEWGVFVNGTLWSNTDSCNYTFSTKVEDPDSPIVITPDWYLGREWSGSYQLPANPEVTYADVYSNDTGAQINSVTVIKGNRQPRNINTASLELVDAESYIDVWTLYKGGVPGGKLSIEVSITGADNQPKDKDEYYTEWRKGEEVLDGVDGFIYELDACTEDDVAISYYINVYKKSDDSLVAQASTYVSDGRTWASVDADSGLGTVGQPFTFTAHVYDSFRDELTDLTGFTFEWYRYVDFENDDYITTTDVPEFTIDSMTEDDFGDYVVRLLYNGNRVSGASVSVSNADWYVEINCDNVYASVGDTITIEPTYLDVNGDPADMEGYTYVWGVSDKNWGAVFELPNTEPTLTLTNIGEDDFTTYHVSVYYGENYISSTYFRVYDKARICSVECGDVEGELGQAVTLTPVFKNYYGEVIEPNDDYTFVWYKADGEEYEWFDVIDGAVDANYTVDPLSEDDLAPANYVVRVYQRTGGDVYFYLCEGRFYISENNPVIKGDINGDGFVDNKDLLLMRKHIADNIKNPFNETQFEAADLNNDGFVDNKDLIKLRRDLASH